MFRECKPCIAIDTIGARTFYMVFESYREQGDFIKALQDVAPVAVAIPDTNSKDAINNGAKTALESVKKALPFLCTGGGDDRIIEFLQIWNDSIPTRAPDVSLTLVMTADMSQLSWRVHGPQQFIVCDMVDFFWNVGTPDIEQDRFNHIGGIINPIIIGSWIDMSTKGGMDGGWVFPVKVSMANALKACDDGKPRTQLSEWTRAQRIEECVSVGRDMGASPPRQTEVRFLISGDNFESRLNTAMAAYCEFGFPVIPDNYVDLLRTWNPSSIELSVITTSEGFVRIGMILPNPDKNMVYRFCQLSGANPQSIFNFQQKLKIEPVFAEFQYLMESFGYGVYNEGLNIVFHYHLDSLGGL